MDFTTKVTIGKQPFSIDYNSKILMLGSCFTTEIGAVLQDYRFDTLVNPFGVLYNPCSIAQSLERLVGNLPFSSSDIIQTNPTDKLSPCKYASFYHHSSFARYSKEEFLYNANNSLQSASEFLTEADTVIITLGTSWIYKLKESGLVVSNCHKRLAQEFIREKLQVGQVIDNLKQMVGYLKGKRIIFTVSPIRHFRDGAHENTISKATLLLAINELVTKSTTNCISYFPSYEIMMDELRDYRFYAEDMVHPSSVAVKYIFERFKEAFIPQTQWEKMRLNLKETKKQGHIVM